MGSRMGPQGRVQVRSETALNWQRIPTHPSAMHRPHSPKPPLSPYHLHPTHARQLHPAALASVSSEVVLVRVRVRWPVKGRGAAAVAIHRRVRERERGVSTKVRGLCCCFLKEKRVGNKIYMTWRFHAEHSHVEWLSKPPKRGRAWDFAKQMSVDLS